MAQPRVSQQLIIIGGRYGGSKKSAPGNGYVSFNKSLGNLPAVIIAGIKSGIGDEYIFGSGILQFAGFQGYFAGREKPHPAAFNMRIGAIAAAKGTAPFCLQVKHAPVGKIKTGVRTGGIKTSLDGTVPWLVSDSYGIFSHNSGYGLHTFILFQCLQKQR